MRLGLGQASTEYLILLATALFVIMVAFVVIDFLPGIASSIEKQRSDDYWAGARPFSVRAHFMVPNQMLLEMKNNEAVSLVLQNVRLGGVPLSFYNHTNPFSWNATTACGGGKCALLFHPGQTWVISTANFTEMNPCLSGKTFLEGEQYSVNLTFTYHPVNSGAAEEQEGNLPLVGDCTSGTVAASALEISTASLPDGQEEASYSTTLKASGGAAPYSWTVKGLPKGLAYDSGTGVIRGTPVSGTSGGSPYEIGMEVTDSTGASAGANLKLAISAPAALEVTSTSLPEGQEGAEYLAALQASGGKLPYAWTVKGLPDGLNYDPATGDIYGTPALGTSGGSPYEISIAVTDRVGATASARLKLAISAPAALEITSTSLPEGMEGVDYAAKLQAIGGAAPYTWKIDGLPSGLKYSETGVISGIPDSGTNGGSPYEIDITVQDSVGATAGARLKLAITAPAVLEITTAKLQAAECGAQYSQALEAAGGVLPYGWTVSGLPTGLEYNSKSGEITGNPGVSGACNICAQVDDSAGGHAYVELPLTVSGGVIICDEWMCSDLSCN